MGASSVASNLPTTLASFPIQLGRIVIGSIIRTSPHYHHFGIAFDASSSLSMFFTIAFIAFDVADDVMALISMLCALLLLSV